MFNCTIATMNSYFRYGLFILVHEAMAECSSKQKAMFSASLNKKTRLVFIDADATFFYPVFEQACYLKQDCKLIIIIILLKGTRLSPDISPNNVDSIIYKTDEEVEIKDKIKRILKQHVLRKKMPTKYSLECAKTSEFFSSALTQSELVVIDLFKRGFTGKAISQYLNRSEKTVSSQKCSAMNKLGVRSNMDLFRHCCK